MTDKKLPAIQFYPGDWLRDPGVRACSLQARGLWIEMLCLMHDGAPYGHLTINGRAIDARTLSRLVGAEMKRTCASLKELASNGVYSQTKDGIIYSRRMVKDAYLRAVRAKAGSTGGKATTTRMQILLKQTLKQKPKQTPPSSSSSSDVKGLQPKPLIRKSVVKHPDRAHANSEGQRLGLAPSFNGAPTPTKKGSRALADDSRGEMRQFILEHVPLECRPDIDVGILDTLLHARATFEIKAAWAIFVRPGEKSYAWAKSRNFSMLEFMRQIPTLVEHDDFQRLKRGYRDAETLGAATRSMSHAVMAGQANGRIA